ncbi:MAG: c-type cytochrome biogenesis protein CcsB [Actinobacteria bacterium]|nr:c-type cytochrome biogenesis protein CcsB [Actinomycetota bacterium]
MNADLALLSNQFVYAAMGVYTLALISFAVALAATRGQVVEPQRVDAAAQLAKVPAGVADTGSSAHDAGPAVERAGVPELPPGRRAGNIAMSLTWLATGMLAVGVVLRGVSAGRVPWGNMYEFSITAALAVSVVFLLMSIKHDLRWLGIFVTGAVLLTLGLAVTVLYTESAQLVPALKSWWLVIHVSAAIICAGGFTLAFVFSGAYLIRDRAERRSPDGVARGWLSARLPDRAKLDRMAYQVVAFTFPLWTFAVIAGAIWAENAWGRYWGWDPKETWAFITWVVFAGYLHARATSGWKGRRAAWIAILGFATFMFNYFGVNMLMPGLHSYAGV